MANRPEISNSLLPVPVGNGARESRKSAGSAPDSTPFAAQLIGQPGRKRGLKGGPPVLEEAKAAYLEAEWSGPLDRRTPTGRITKTEV